MKFLTTVLAASALLLVAPAQAQMQNTDTIPNFNIETLEPVLTQLGYTHERRTTSDGTTFLITQRNGRNVAMGPRVCGGNQCRGLLLMAPMNDTASAVEMNRFNRVAYYASASASDDGRLAITRYLIGDYGMVAGSFAVNLNVFENAIAEWFTLKNPSTNQISFEPLDPESAPSTPSMTDPAAIEIITSLAGDAAAFNSPLAADLLQPGNSHEVTSGLEGHLGE